MIVLRKPNIFLYSATLEGNDNFCKEMNCLDRFYLLAQDQACFLKSLYYDALKRNCLSPFVPHLSLLWHFYFNRNTPRVRYWRRRRHVRREAVREVRSQANHRIRNRKSFMAHERLRSTAQPRSSPRTWAQARIRRTATAKELANPFLQIKSTPAPRADFISE